MDSIVSIIPEIKSWFPLIALVVACIAFIIRRAIKKDESLIELASEEDRASLLDRHFRGRSVDLDNLSSGQKCEYALNELKGRQRNLFYVFVIALVAIFLSSIVVFTQEFFAYETQKIEAASNNLQLSRGEEHNDVVESVPQKTTGVSFTERRPPRPEDFEEGERPPRPEDFKDGERPPRPEDFKDGERPPRPEDFKDGERP